MPPRRRIRACTARLVFARDGREGADRHSGDGDERERRCAIPVRAATPVFLRQWRGSGSATCWEPRMSPLAFAIRHVVYPAWAHKNGSAVLPHLAEMERAQY